MLGRTLSTINSATSFHGRYVDLIQHAMCLRLAALL